MSEQRIGVYYSPGRRFSEVLQAVRQAYPEADITAVVPPEYPMQPSECSLCNRVLHTESARFSISSPEALRTFLGQLRAERFDKFVIMFDTPRMRVFAGLVCAPETLYYTFDSRLVPIRGGALRAAADMVLDRAKGWATYAKVSFLVGVLRVGKRT